MIFGKIYLRAATRTATVTTRTDGKALTPELAGVVVFSADVGGTVVDDAAAAEELVAVGLTVGATPAVAVAEGVTLVVFALQ